MGLDKTNMSLGFSPKRDPATGTSCHIEMSLVANSENILFKKRNNKGADKYAWN